MHQGAKPNALKTFITQTNKLKNNQSKNYLKCMLIHSATLNQHTKNHVAASTASVLQNHQAFKVLDYN